MLYKDSILKFSPDVLRRFESDIDYGTYFLYHIINKKRWVGNKSAHEILIHLDGKNKIENLYQIAKNIFQCNDIDAVKNSIDVILYELLEKEMLYVLDKGNNY